MNILYHFRTRGTGAEGVHISGIASAFEALNHQVRFSSPTGTDPRTLAGSDPFADARTGSLLARISRHCPDCLFEGLELAYNAVAYLRNRRLLAQLSTDLIYERHAFFLCSTGYLARSRNIPLIVEVNEIVGDERIRRQPLLAPLAKWSDRQLFRRANLIVVVSQHLKRRISAMGIAQERILVLPNAVDADAYAECANGSHIRRMHNLGQGPVIGFLGWLVHWHLLKEFLAVFAELTKCHPDMKLLLVGDGPLRPELEQQADSIGIADKLVITGPVPHEEVPQYIAAMDIPVIPHSNEYRSPIKLFEYMGQEKPVVSPNTEPIRSVVDDLKNGVLFPAGSTEKLKGALQLLLTEPALRKKIGKQARKDVLAHHTWKQNTVRILKAVSALQPS